MFFRFTRKVSTSESLAKVSESLIRLPGFLEFYRPVIESSEKAIESIVSFTGLPWWLSISALTVCIRTCNLPFLVLQFRSISNAAKAIPEYHVLLDIIKNSESSRQDKALAFIKSAREINKNHNTKFYKVFGYALMQFPQFLTFVWGVRSLCYHNEELKAGGTLWFTDLSVPDPYMILPVLSVGLTYLNLQKGINEQNKNWLINRLRYYVQIWIILTLPLSANWPAAVHCYWLTSSAFTAIQSHVMRRPGVIAYLNPNIDKDTKNLFTGNIEQNEHYRLSNLIHAGFEGYSRTSEENVEALVKTYLKEQKKLSSHKDKYYRS